MLDGIWPLEWSRNYRFVVDDPLKRDDEPGSAAQPLGLTLTPLPREHRHSAIRYVTPDERHSGRELDILAQRHELYQRARTLNPERWTRSTRNWTPLGAVILNPQGASEAHAP